MPAFISTKPLIFTILLYPPLNTALFAHTEEQCIRTIIKAREHNFHPRLEQYSEKCVQNFPENARLQRLRGLILLELKYYTTAALAFKKAIELESEQQTDAFFLLLRSQILSGDPLNKHKETLSLFKKHFAADSHSLAEAATILIDAGKNHSAYDYLSSLIKEEFPDKWLYHFQLGRLYYESLAWDDAMQQLLLSHQQKQDFPPTILYLGLVWDAKKNYHFALSFYKHALLSGLDIKTIPGLEKRISELLEKEQEKP